MRLQKKSSASGYTYTNTRVKAMKAKLLNAAELQKFAKMSLAEIARYLQETEYSREISELSVKHAGMNLIEYALNRNLENTFAKISGFAIQAAKTQINLYLRRYDVWNIKTILRGKSAGAPNETINNELIASGTLSRPFLERVTKEAQDMNAAIEHFKHTEYYGIMKKFSGDLTKMEDELDKLYYAIVLERAGGELRSYIRKEIFVKNVLNRLRGKRANIKVDIIPGEVKFAVPYQEDTVEARIFMRKMLIESALRMIHEVKRNIRPVLGYFVYKENEIANIRLLTRAKHSGLRDELVSQMVI